MPLQNRYHYNIKNVKTIFLRYPLKNNHGYSIPVWSYKITGLDPQLLSIFFRFAQNLLSTAGRGS